MFLLPAVYWRTDASLNRPKLHNYLIMSVHRHKGSSFWIYYIQHYSTCFTYFISPGCLIENPIKPKVFFCKHNIKSTPCIHVNFIISGPCAHDLISVFNTPSANFLSPGSIWVYPMHDLFLHHWVILRAWSTIRRNVYRERWNQFILWLATVMIGLIID